jgi:predicted Zn-dependent protease
MNAALTQRDYFGSLADAVCDEPHGAERVTLFVQAEASDFLRFNHAAVRQATHVTQAHATVAVVDGGRKAASTLALTGRSADDIAALQRERASLLSLLADVPEDPYLLLPDAVASSERDEAGSLPAAPAVIDAVATHAAGTDLVGFYAGGPVVRAFADSRGQRNWHRVESFQIEWCLYQAQDKAVKSLYAGTRWSDAEFAGRIASSRRRLALLAQPALSLAPGAYRAYLAPAAMVEVLDLLGWSGFGLKDRRSGTSTLMRLAHGDATLDARMNLSEATALGVAPAFTCDGFTRPDRVPLVSAGRAAETLNSPRSAREFGVPTNGATADESPESLRLEPGTLPQADVLATLDNGLYISNLWYLNYSDRQACRLTGMTRFACFRVEHGALVAPLNVMRFDDSFLRLFGDGLVALTDTVERFIGTETYERRQLGSTSTPGAIVEGLHLTL